MTKVHFRSYIHKKMILFPQRIDKDIAEDDPVRLLDALVDNLMLEIMSTSFISPVVASLIIHK